jgi:hypothetical protein
MEEVMLMSAAAILTDSFEKVQKETLSLDDVNHESYDPWDAINERLDEKKYEEDANTGSDSLIEAVHTARRFFI